jgi:hypothetical protein
MGSADRIIRVLIAIAFVTLYLTGVISGIWGIVLIVLSIVFVGTSLISFCPLYLPLGLSTLRKNLTSKK